MKDRKAKDASSVVAKAGRKGKADSNQTRKNPWGHFRKRQSIEEFARCIERRGDVPVLREFSNNTASWVIANFAPLELEIHQAMTVGRASRGQNQRPDYKDVRARFPRLAIVATDGEMKDILEGDPAPKKVAASIFARILQRKESSILRWAQGKK